MSELSSRRSDLNTDADVRGDDVALLGAVEAGDVVILQNPGEGSVVVVDPSGDS